MSEEEEIDYSKISDAEWRKRLTPEQYRILRQKGTESCFTNQYHDWHEEGTFCCAGCSQPLFSTDNKFDSGTGWPSFFKPIAIDHLRYEDDWKLAVPRTEVLCSRCGGHLGHVFDDGPPPTGKRYCINSGALQFIKEDAME